MKRSSKSRDRRLNLLSWGWFLFFSTLALGVLFHGWKRTNSVSRVATEVQAVTYRTSATTTIAGAKASPIYGLRNIEDVRVGDRVFARNPEISDEERATWTEPDWSTWRRVHLEMEKPDGGILRIEMIRPSIWFAHNGARRNSTIFLDLPEMGAQGRAKVVSTSKCPPIQQGPVQVVTATFAHPPSTAVIDVRFEGQSTLIGVTDNHLFWSADRGEFVPIGKMAIGESVLTFHGDEKRIEQKLPRPGPSVVYNLEVYGEHVFFVGKQGVLVHNSYQRGPSGIPIQKDFNRWIDRLTVRGLKRLMKNKVKKDAIDARLRHPGKYHEWLPVSRVAIFKEWGYTAADIHRFRTLTKELHPLSKVPTKGWWHKAPNRKPYRSNFAHNDLLDRIDRLHNRFRRGLVKDPKRAYKYQLGQWAKKWMKNGVKDLPRGLGGSN